MADRTNRDIEEITDDLQRINREFREKVRNGLKESDSFIKLNEIEKMGRELTIHSQKLYIEETTALLNDIDESMLLHKKKPNTKQKG